MGVDRVESFEDVGDIEAVFLQLTTTNQFCAKTTWQRTPHLPSLFQSAPEAALCSRAAFAGPDDRLDLRQVFVAFPPHLAVVPQRQRSAGRLDHHPGDGIVVFAFRDFDDSLQQQPSEVRSGEREREAHRDHVPVGVGVERQGFARHDSLRMFFVRHRRYPEARELRPPVSAPIPSGACTRTYT